MKFAHSYRFSTRRSDDDPYAENWTRNIYKHAGYTVFIDRRHKPFRLAELFVVLNGQLWFIGEWRNSHACVWYDIEQAATTALDVRLKQWREWKKFTERTDQ